MILINTFSISRLNNQEFVAFCLNLKKLMRDSDTETMGVSDEVSEQFDTVMQKLSDQVYNAAGSQYTQLMQQADAKRDLLFKKVRLKLQTVEIAEEGSPLLAIADKVQTELLNKYKPSIIQKAYQEETAILNGFIYDLRNKLSEDDLEALGLTEDVGKLDQANNDFINAYSQRSGERAESDGGLTAKLRSEMVDIYAAICLAVQYHANGKDKEAAAACEAFIKPLNVILADAKKRLEQRTGNGSAEGGTDTEGGEGTGTEGDNTNTGGGSTNTGGGDNTNTGGNANTDSGNTNTGGNTSGDQGNIHDGMMEF